MLERLAAYGLAVMFMWGVLNALHWLVEAFE